MEVKTVDPAGKRKYPARSVVSVQRHSDGSVTRVRLSDSGGGRKVSRRMRKMDRRLRKLARAEIVAANEYLRRHDRSNRKKRNGAMRDLPGNLRRSAKKGRKVF